MQSVTNVKQLRDLSLRLIDDIISEKYVLSGPASDQQMLNHVNKQINNVVNITKMEMAYVKDSGGKVKFLEYAD